MLIESLKKEKQKMREEVRKEVRKESEEARAILIARTLLDRGMSVAEVAEITGVSRDKIKKITLE